MKGIGTAVALIATTCLLRAGAESVVFSGANGAAWESAESWTPARVPVAADDVVIPSGKSATASSALSCRTLSVTGTLTVTAAPLEDLTPFGGTEGELQLALYKNATVVSCSGDMTFAAGAKVIPTNDPLTGTPVIFRARNITVEKGATVDASEKGWGRSSYEDTPPAHTTSNINTKTFTYALGSATWTGVGSGYKSGGGYGGMGGGTAVAPYGFDFAPLFPGSPGASTGNLGGGTICLQATGDLVVWGTLRTAGRTETNGSGSSGGGIWLSGSTVDDQDAELISASTPDRASGNYANGGGGRIAVSVGYSAAQLETMAGGTLPVGEVLSHSADNIYAKGSVNASWQANSGVDGTAVITSNPDAVATIAFSSPGVPALKIEGVSDTPVAKTIGSSSFDIPAYAYWSLDPTGVRYSYAGAVVSNATSEIASFTSSQRNLSFTTVVGEGPYTVTLQWSNREVRRVVEVPSDYGTVKIDGTDLGSTGIVWKASGAATTIELVPAEGCTFKCWNGNAPRLHAKGNPMTLSTGYSARLTALVDGCEATGQAIKWAKNVAGSWDDPTKWDKGVVPSLLDDVTISTGTVSVPECFSAKSLTVSGGSLTVGVKDGTTRVFGTVASNLTVGATMTVYPARAYEYDKTTQLTFQNSLYDAASVMRVGGALTVNGKLYPENDPLTGVPTIWRVGSFTVGSAGVVWANCGFGWRELVEGDPLFEGTFQLAEGSTYYTHGYGRGYQYTRYSYGASGYGGDAGGVGTLEYGRAYGFEYAPLMPGSGYPSATVDMMPAGTVCVFAEGDISVNGTVKARRNTNANWYCSGGAIWLSGASIALAEAAVVDAQGDGDVGWQCQASSGGRILFTIGVSDSVLDELIADKTPESLGLTVTAIDKSQVTVAGGVHGMKGYENGQDGTMWQLLDASAMTDFSVVGVPQNYLAEDVSYNTMNASYGSSITRSAPEWAFNNEAQTDSRYAYAGYVVSNATAEVSSGTAADHTATISFVKPEGPYTLYWKWGARQTYHSISAQNADWGSVTLNGEAFSFGTFYWSPEERTDVIVATPAEGCEFVCWTGDVTEDQIYSPMLKISAAEVYHVTAVFRQTTAATTYHWKKDAKGLWSVASNWEEGNIPGASDSVEMASGTCIVSNRFEVQNLIVTNTASLSVRACADVSIAQDVLVADSASLHIVGRPTTAAHTWTNGATQVTVGGTVCITNAAVLYVECDDYSGGAPVFHCKDFILGTNATVSAKGLGFGGKVIQCQDYTPTWYGQPENLCPYGGNGAGYNHGAGYGGYGVSYGTHTLDISQEQIAYGYPYGLALTPIHPGASSGTAGSTTSTQQKRGGGLIRIHANRMWIEGTVDASADQTSTSGGAAGGGIWITTTLRRNMIISPGARLLACGGPSGFNSQGGGGRIAIGVGLTDAMMAQMIGEGRWCTRIEKRHVFGLDEFASRYPDVTVDVKPGDCKGVYPTDEKYYGTFRFVDGTTPGLTIIVE